jgi:orotidine-5'-phosphate decarboxylase
LPAHKNGSKLRIRQSNPSFHLSDKAFRLRNVEAEMNSFADSLISTIKAKNNPCVIGLDYHQKLLPSFVINELKQNPTPTGYRNAISGFFKRIIDIVAPLVPVVKPQISLLESMTWVGSQIFLDIVEYAKQQGLLVIADAKRSDISSSALGYANAFLGTSNGPTFASGYGANAMTVNAFLGRDTIDPYLEVCKSLGKGIFILVKTSNKGSTETQDVILEETGEPIFSSYAKMVNEIGGSIVGDNGYSSIGAVVGATFPDQAKQIRRLMPKAIILVPGYGAQGATATDAAWNFNDDGLGAIVNASRSITYGFSQPDITPEKYDTNVREKTLMMIDDINNAIEHKGRN